MKGILVYAIYTFGEILSTALVVRAIMSWFTQPKLLSKTLLVRHSSRTGQDLYGIDPLHRTDRRAMPKFYEQI